MNNPAIAAPGQLYNNVSGRCKKTPPHPTVAGFLLGWCLNWPNSSVIADC
jgi:hypothetical protein